MVDHVQSERVVDNAIVVMACILAGVLVYGLAGSRQSQGTQKASAGQTLEPRATQLQHTMLDATFKAICLVESHGHPSAYNKYENARGIAQITPIFVEDCNNILGADHFTHNDAWRVDKSYAMFRVYCLHYYPDGPPWRWASAFKDGPNPRNWDDDTEDYAKRVENLIYETRTRR